MRRSTGGERRLDRVGFHFFAGIDRRLHAPLALVVSPVRDVVGRVASRGLRNGLRLVCHGTRHLLGLIGRLLSFHGGRVTKLRLALSRKSVITCIHDVYTSFLVLSRGGRIRLAFFSTVRSLGVSFSRSGVNGIIVGLLSGTFGFAPSKKHISITLRVSGRVSKELLVGMSSANINVESRSGRQVFRHFCRIRRRRPRRRSANDNVNLDLMHSFIALRRNAIHIISGINSNDIFLIRLPIGRMHMDPPGPTPLARRIRRRRRLLPNVRRRTLSISLLSSVRSGRSRGRGPLTLVISSGRSLITFVGSDLDLCFHVRSTSGNQRT